MDFNDKCFEFISLVPSLKPREMIECRFYGDRKWYTARITKVFSSGLSDIRLEDGSQEHQTERHMIRKSREADYQDSTHDPGMFEPNDYVEIKLAGTPWQPGQIISSNNEGTYNVVYDSSVEERNVAGRWIRHSFRSNQLVEVRPYGQIAYNPAVIQNQDANGTYSIRYLDGQIEDNVNPRRIFPSNRRHVYINALTYALEKLGYQQGTRSNNGGRSTNSPYATYYVGDKVESNLRDANIWIPGRISRVYGNSKYDIEYLDGTTEYEVPSFSIRSVSPSPSTKSGRGAARFRSPKRQVIFADEMGQLTNNVRPDSTPSANIDPVAAGTSTIAKKMASVAVANQQPAPYEGARTFGYSHGDMYYRSFREGMRVEARFHGHGSYCPGFISRVNPDGTYDVSFDSNEVFPSLPPEVIRPFSVGEQHFYGDVYTMNSTNSFNVFQQPSPFIEPYFFNGFGGAHSDVRMNSDQFRGSQFDGRGDHPFNAGPRQPPVLRKGLQVEIQTGGRWAPGRIIRTYPQGSYDISLEDGSIESNIPRQNIRMQNYAGRYGDLTNSQGGAFLYRPDMLVEARLRGSSKFYPGYIHGCHPDGTYDVCFEDGTTETGLKQNMLRPFGYLEAMARDHLADGPFSRPGQFGQNGLTKVGYEFCSGYYGSQVSDGYGYDSMKRSSEREFRGHPNYFGVYSSETNFGVYHPREVRTDGWNPMLAYVYDAFQEYFYRYQNGTKNPGLQSRRGLSKDTQQLSSPGSLPFGCELAIMPCSEWCEFSGGEPTIGRLVWNGWRVSCPFFFRPHQDAPRNFTIKVFFYVRAVVVGEVAIDVMYPGGAEGGRSRDRIQSAYVGGRDLRYLDASRGEPIAGRGTREQFTYSGTAGSGDYVDVRSTMFRNIFIVQMENDEGYEMLMAETVEAVPGLVIRRRDPSTITSSTSIRSADRIQFVCSRDGGQLSSDLNADFRGVQSILVTPEERARKMILTFSDLPMIFPQSADKLPGSNFSFIPEVNIYRWQYQANGRPQMFLRQRLYEASRTISKCYFETFDRPVPLGMLLLPVGDDYFNFNELMEATTRDRLEGSMWNLFFMCEDHSSQTMRDEFAHQPIEIRFDPQFLVDAYPLLKATVAILMYCRVTFKDNIGYFPTPFNIYGLSKRFDENMLIAMSNFYDEQAMRWSSGFGVGMGAEDTLPPEFGYGSSKRDFGDYNNGFNRTQNGYNNPVDARGKYAPSTPLVSKSFSNMDPSTPFVGQLFPSASVPNLANSSNAFAARQARNPFSDGDQRESSLGGKRLLPNVDFLVNAVDCAETAVASIQNWALWRASRRVRARLDELAPTWLQQCDMRPVELDLKVWWVSSYSYRERWESLHWMVKGPDAPTYVSPGPGGLGALQTPSPTCGFSTASFISGPMIDIASHLAGEAGIKDYSVANDIAMKLSREGFETWDDVLRLDEFVGAKNNFDEVKWFLREIGIPLVIASKLMMLMRNYRGPVGY